MPRSEKSRKPLLPILAALAAGGLILPAFAGHELEPLKIERLDPVPMAPTPLPAPTPAPTSGAPAETPDELRSHVMAYVEAMLNGDRAAILEVREYYRSIHLGSDARILRIVRQPDESYIVDLEFRSEGRIDQGIDSTGKRWARRRRAREEYQVSLVFLVKQGLLKWTRKLEVPFVRPGREKRYLIGG